MDDQIVDAHGHEVNADFTMTIGQVGELKFGADPIRRCDQNWIFKSCSFGIEKSTKSTKC